MVLIFRQMSRFLIAVAVCVLLLSSLTVFFIPQLVEKANITVDTVQLEEPTVLLISANTSAEASTSLSSVLEKLEIENTTAQLDEQFWETVQIDSGRVFTYRRNGNTYIKESFVGFSSSSWMLVFTSTNVAGEQYKLKVSLNIN